MIAKAGTVIELAPTEASSVPVRFDTHAQAVAAAPYIPILDALADGTSLKEAVKAAGIGVSGWYAALSRLPFLYDLANRQIDSGRLTVGLQTVGQMSKRLDESADEMSARDLTDMHRSVKRATEDQRTPQLVVFPVPGQW